MSLAPTSRWSFEQGALLLLGLMATAIVWPHYMLLALPFLLLIVANPLTLPCSRVTLIGCTLLLLPARPSPLWPLATVMMFVALVMDGGNERNEVGSPEAGGMTESLHRPFGRLLAPTPWNSGRLGSLSFTPLRIWAEKPGREPVRPTS